MYSIKFTNTGKSSKWRLKSGSQKAEKERKKPMKRGWQKILKTGVGTSGGKKHTSFPINSRYKPCFAQGRFQEEEIKSIKMGRQEGLRPLLWGRPALTSWAKIKSWAVTLVHCFKSLLQRDQTKWKKHTHLKIYLTQLSSTNVLVSGKAKFKSWLPKLLVLRFGL